MPEPTVLPGSETSTRPFPPTGYPYVRETQSLFVISPENEDRDFLKPIFEAADWRVRSARTYHEAKRLLVTSLATVMICEWDLPDGTWKDILSLIAPIPDPPALLVASRDISDARWAEVLNLGAYDMLAKPFHREEVTRVVGLACLDRTRQ